MLNLPISNIIENFFKYLIIIFPAALIIGPAPTDVIMSILALFILIHAIYYREFYYLNNILFKAIFLFYIFLIFCSFMSTNILHSLESSIFYIRFGLFAACLAYFLDKYKNLEIWFFASLIFCVLFVSIDGFIQYFNGKNIFGFISEHNTRISGVFKDELILGSYVSRLLPLCLYYIVYKYGNSNIIFSITIFSIIIFDTLVFLSGERSAFLYLLIITIGVIFLTHKLRIIRIISIIISFVIIASVSLVDSGLKNRMINNTLKQFTTSTNYIDSGKKFYFFSEEHNDHYTTAFRMFIDSPIYGHGPKMFRKLCMDDKYKTIWGCSTHPHNTYMQLLSETGIVGFLSIFFLFLLIFYKFIKQFIYILFFNSKNKLISDDKIYIYLALFISLWPIIPTGNFFGNWLNAIYYIPIALLLRKKYE